MRRVILRAIACASVIGAAVIANAVGNGDVRATPGVTIITIASTTGTGAGTATLQNTTSATTYSVLVGSDPSCDPQLTFLVTPSNPVSIAPATTRSVQLDCPARGSAAMRRCLYHATNNANGTALADFMSVCLYGSSSTLVPQQTALDFGTVGVGGNAMLQLDVRNDGAQPITRIYLQTTDLDGNFQLSTPCNPDAQFCEATVAAAAGATLPVQIKCTPQSPGQHTAQLYVGTSTFQLLSQPVTMQCMGAPASAPVLVANPTNIDLPSPFEVTDGSASTVLHLRNAGSGTLLINDIRTVDVDAGAATDWTYSASGECSGVITAPCSLDGGEQVDINLTFDPSAIGRRRATLLISYRDTIDRTEEIPLNAHGLGATLETLVATPSLAFGRVPVGRSSTIDTELVNRGNRDVTAQLSLLAGTAPPFSISPASSIVLAPNVEKTVAMTCTPTTPGIAMTTLTAQAMDAFSGSPLTLNATCEGTTLALYANPTALNLGELRTGGSPVRRTIQLLSTGAPVTLAGQPQQESVNTAITLSVLSQMTTPASFDITITPATEGQISASIAITDSNGDTLRIPVVANVVTADYEVAAKLDLGTFCVNQPTTSSNASLASVDTATIALDPPTLGTGSPFQLAFTAPTRYPTTLRAGGTATVAVTPQRQSAATQLSDTLTWHTDVEGKPSASTMLGARFIDQGGAIAPPALDFGKVTVHLYSENGQRVVIQNCNPTPLVLDPPMIKTPFSIDSPNFPAMLNPNETVTFSVGFHPTRIGTVTDTLRITSPQLPGAPLEVTLFGEGGTSEMVTPDAGTGSNHNSDTSFYACSCRSAQPGGVIPILVALLGVLVPRRRAPVRR